MRLVILIFASVIISEASAACCEKHGSFGCCVTGRCNIFCCNCDGDCRDPETCHTRSKIWGSFFGSAIGSAGARPVLEAVARRLKRAADVGTLENALKVTVARFASVDRNGDGVIDLTEFKTYATSLSVGRQSQKTSFDDMDQNQDGFIEPFEFDKLQA